MPMYGSSLATGSSISNAFFWAINRSQDATFFHDWMFSRGNGLGAEYRYMLGPQAQGDFRYYWLDEKEAIINGRTRQRAAQQVDARRPEPEPAVRAVGARRGSTTSPTSPCSRPTTTTSTTPRTARARIDGGLSGAWRNLSAQRHLPAAPRRSTTPDDSTVSGQAPGFTAALSGVRLGRCRCSRPSTPKAASIVYINRFGDDRTGPRA